MWSKKTKWIILFILVFAVLGYCREFFFLNINNILFIKYYDRPTQMPVPAIMTPFLNFDYATLYYLKYPFTVMGAFVFYLANHFTIKKVTGSSFLCRINLIAYIVMLVLAAISMTYGYFAHRSLQNDEYTLSRWLMGIAQSPIICLILLASEKLYNSVRHDQQRHDSI
jgi:hypothetical protein